MVITTLLSTFFLRIYNRRNNYVKIANYKIKFYSFQSIKYLFTEIFVNLDYIFFTENRNPLIIDCGSNIGMSIFFFKTIYPNSRIIGFEPSKKTYLYLQDNIRQNQLTSIELYNKALSQREGLIEFYIDDNDPGSLISSTNKSRMSKQVEIVESTLLSNFVNGQVDFLKIDIEGSEMDVILDLYSSDKLRFIKEMVVEFHHHINKELDGLSKFLEILELSNFGYLLDCKSQKPFLPGSFQDILIYAYNKKSKIY